MFLGGDDGGSGGSIYSRHGTGAGSSSSSGGAGLGGGDVGGEDLVARQRALEAEKAKRRMTGGSFAGSSGAGRRSVDAFSAPGSVPGVSAGFGTGFGIPSGFEATEGGSSDLAPSIGGSGGGGRDVDGSASRSLYSTGAIGGVEGDRSAASKPEKTAPSPARHVSVDEDDFDDLEEAPLDGGGGGGGGTMIREDAAPVVPARGPVEASTAPPSSSSAPSVVREVGRGGDSEARGAAAGGGGRGGGGGEGGGEPEVQIIGLERACDLSDMHAFALRPTPREAGIVQCYVEREKARGMGNPTFSLYLKERDRFVLAARKRTGKGTSNWIIADHPTELVRTGPHFMGKLRGNFMGTEYVVYSSGESPEEYRKSGGEVRKELACIKYASNVIGARGPRKMQVSVPRIDPATGEPTVFAPKEKGDEGILDLFKQGRTGDMVSLVNKKPRWDPEVGAYVLAFNGRVTCASVKNFQLVTPDDEERVVLQFGRVGKDLFTMDYQWPLSPLQAFGISLCACDSKLAVE